MDCAVVLHLVRPACTVRILNTGCDATAGVVQQRRVGTVGNEALQKTKLGEKRRVKTSGCCLQEALRTSCVAIRTCQARGRVECGVPRTRSLGIGGRGR
jgi:hypothetical protein